MKTLLTPNAGLARNLADAVTAHADPCRLLTATDAATMAAALDAGTDVMLWSADGDLPLDGVLAAANARDVPVLVVADAALDPTALLRAGADAVLAADRPDAVVISVGRRLRERHRLRQLGERYRTLLARSPDAIALLRNGRHDFVNAAYLALTGHDDADTLIGQPFDALVDPNWSAEELLAALSHSAPVSGAELLIGSAGGPLPVRLYAVLPGIEAGEPLLEVTLHLSDDVQGSEHLIQYLSLHDRITGLHNGRYLAERLEEYVQSIRHGGDAAILILLTLDNFDDLRMQVGLAASERLLGDLGRLLERIAGPDGTAARLKDARFGVLAPVHHEPQRFVDSLREQVQDHVFTAGGQLVTARITLGATAVASDVTDPGELLARAERALVDAATSERRAAIYRPQAGGGSLHDLDADWGRRLAEAIRDDRLRLLFQPVVSLNCPPQERYGILMRVLDGDGTSISPTQFLPSAERTGMARTLDRWVVSHALDQLAWLRGHGHDTLFFIKLTDGSLQEEDMPGWIERELQRHAIPPTAVVFEMKEATVAAHLAEALVFVEALKRLGCAFALDDFGLGQEPFQIVEHLPVEYLKFDPVFTRHLAERPQDRETMAGLVKTAHEMGRLTIAQHVENAVSLSVLWGLGIHLIQGYFLQAPSEAMEFDFRSLA
ncbi:MAG: EAL domain-containing protein [Ectothiorhodospiraceae bacterium]|jgi:diguanylate cyclase (GGDEF)-like protein|nr:EAL domain-containing protein [Ectothiorhodospiraceae bacterium]